MAKPGGFSDAFLAEVAMLRLMSAEMPNNGWAECVECGMPTSKVFACQNDRYENSPMARERNCWRAKRMWDRIRNDIGAHPLARRWTPSPE